MLQQRKRYGLEFKEAAVELVRIGKPVAEVAEELGIGSGLIYRWISKNKPQEAAQPAEQEAVSSTKELHRLQKENAQLKLEVDILKKAAVILGTNLPLSVVK